jgi:hypothetical protein
VREALAVVEDLPFARLEETDHVLQERALAAAAAAHDDEDRAARDLEVQVAHEDEAAVGHGEIAHGDVRVVPGGLVASGVVHHRLALRCRGRLHSTAKKPSATTIRTMLVTTAEVAASPTAEALLPHCMPRRQPESAIRMPKMKLLLMPITNCVMFA